MAKSTKLYKIGGMELTEDQYKRYKAMPKDMKNSYKAKYKDNTTPPFTNVYDSDGNFKRTIGKSADKSKRK